MLDLGSVENSSYVDTRDPLPHMDVSSKLSADFRRGEIKDDGTEVTITVVGSDRSASRSRRIRTPVLDYGSQPSPSITATSLPSTISTLSDAVKQFESFASWKKWLHEWVFSLFRTFCLLTYKLDFRLGADFDQLLTLVTEMESKYKSTIALTCMIATIGSSVGKEIVFLLETISRVRNPGEAYMDKTSDRLKELKEGCHRMVEKCQLCAESFQELSANLCAVGLFSFDNTMTQHIALLVCT